MDATTPLRCPSCRAIDWFNDGYVIVENEATGEIVRRRVMPSDPGLVGALWSCTDCGYEVPVPTKLASALNEVRVAHPE